MKYSAALALGVAHLAFGKSVQKVAPREPNGRVSVNGQLASQIEIAELQRLFGFGVGTGFDINVLWVNVGGGAATTVINQAQTVTVTQTVVGGAAETLAGLPPVGAPPVGAPPVAGVPGEVAATPTDVAVANPVVGATGATHSVTVGGPQGLAFNPPQLVATPGDTVIFTFLSQNHTATQSAFETPCDPLAGGMDSGFQSNPNNTVNPPPQVAMQVMVSTPLWFYCRQNNHCGKGMTFSINPTADKTHAMFQSLAIQQRGNGGGSAITGGQPAAAPPGAPPAAAPPAGSPPAAVAPGAPGAPAGQLPAGVVTGAGTVAADGTCICAVSCQFDNSQFPVAAQGAGAFGGVGGAVPMVMPAARRL
jgi:plastocyanin